MNLTSTYINRAGETFPVKYYEGIEPTENLEGKVLHSVHAFCFYNGKMVLINHRGRAWQPPGGHIEPGENYTDACIREVHEETNMKVLHQELIGFQDVYEPNQITRQIRMFCIVEPYGPFVSDPDGDVTEIRLIDPADVTKYFNWREIGARVMERALQLLKSAIIQE